MYQITLSKLELQMILAAMTSFDSDLSIFEEEATRDSFNKLFLKISNELKAEND